MPQTASIRSTADKPVLLFLFGWFLLNLLQSGVTELHPDEAYYWVYSRFLDWGYFDHPPMVAIFIKAGYALFENELGVRLFTTIIQCIALFILWRTAEKYGAKAGVFCLVVASLTILHVYGFTTTPDSPLFFFATCFFYLYKKYIDKNSLQNALLLAVCIAALLFSKYHGLFVIIFTLIAQPAVFRRGSFWLVAILSLALFAPHIYWQYANGFPSVQYHLYERSSSGYQVGYTLGFIPGQLLVAGPLIGWFLLYRAWVVKFSAPDPFLRVLKWNAIGFPVLLFLLTFKQNIQPHWTLVAYIPILLLATISLSAQKPKWFIPLAAANIFLVMIFRTLIIFQTPLVEKVAPLYAYFGNKKWAEDLYKVAGNKHVLFIDHWQNAARYDFYTRSTLGYAYASYGYRKSQFDFFPVEDEMQQKAVWINTASQIQKGSRYMGSGRNGYLTLIHNFTSRQKLEVDIQPEKIAAKRASLVPVELEISSPATASYGLSAGEKLHFRYHFLNKTAKTDSAHSLDKLLPHLRLKPHGTVKAKAKLIMPSLPGDYELIFSFSSDPLPGGRNSRRIKVQVY